MESALPQRKPLSSTGNVHGSKLMMPGSLSSRLPKPGSKLIPPSSSVGLPSTLLKQPQSLVSAMAKPTGAMIKRKASPHELPVNKRVKLEPPKAAHMNVRSIPGATTNRTVKAPAKALPARAAISRQPARAAATTTRSAPATKKATVPKPPGGSKARPAWDLKGRLEDMESQMSAYLNKITEANEQMQVLKATNTNLETNVHQTTHQSRQYEEHIDSLKRQLRQSEEELESSSRRLNARVRDLEDSKHRNENRISCLEGDLAASREEASGLKVTVSSMTAAQSGLQAELTCTKGQLEQSLASGRMKDTLISELKDAVTDMEIKSREHEMERRMLHNQVLELKGNIRVFARVRPLLGDETLGHSDIIPNHIHLLGEHNIEVEKLNDSGPNETMSGLAKKDTKNQFKFDRVFGPHSQQASVFEEISQLVQSALDGYNVCIFAYGQTGSGKTHTMEGPTNPSPETEGMIPRAVTQIFNSARQLGNSGWKYTFEASYVEIYNESIRDLLGDGKEGKHEIRMVSKNSPEVMVTDLKLVQVTQESQVHNLLSKAAENRAVAATKCNERSSRSHSVFRLKLSGHNTQTDDTSSGTLNLVDLAGSERLKDSGSSGDRLKETQAINKSLANLGNVIMALANKESHIPYRNSKLTHMLMNSLGGNSKTLMFVNVSPQEECFNETLNSLRFATKVNNCNIGTASQKKN